MLHALIGGKLDSGLCKDTLTSTVFERIFYLPQAAITKRPFGRRIWPGSAPSPDLLWAALIAAGKFQAVTATNVLDRAAPVG